MKEEQILKEGYEIKNAVITSVDLSMSEYGCITMYICLEGQSWGCNYGGYRLGKGYLGAKEFTGSPKGIEYIMRIMNVVGVCKFSELEGKCIRVATKGWGYKIETIGNIIEDKWFNAKEFFDNETKVS